MTSHPWVLLRDGQVRTDADVMLGSNRDEGAMFITLDGNATEVDLEEFWRTGGFGVKDGDIEQLKQIYLDQDYPLDDDKNVYWWAGQRSLGDFMFTCVHASEGSEAITRAKRAQRRC
jgi:hypothetical protein